MTIIYRVHVSEARKTDNNKEIENCPVLPQDPRHHWDCQLWHQVADNIYSAKKKKKRWQTISSVDRYPLIQPKIGARKPEVRKCADRARLNGAEYVFVFRLHVGLNVYFIRFRFGFSLTAKVQPIFIIFQWAPPLH